MGRAVAVLTVVFLIAACSPYYNTEPGPKVPPAVVGIEWSHGYDYDSDCALGLTQDGLTFVAGAATPWGLGGIAAEWLSWTITGSLAPVGESAANCWNSLVDNGGQFALYLKCYGEPYIKYWFDNIGQAELWAAIPMCQCNVACNNNMRPAANAGAWNAQLRAQAWYNHCQAAFLIDILCWLPAQNGWAPLWGGGANRAETTDPELPVEGSPLPADWQPPPWDTSVPVPPHPAGCVRLDVGCEDQPS